MDLPAPEAVQCALVARAAHLWLHRLPQSLYDVAGQASWLGSAARMDRFVPGSGVFAARFDICFYPNRCRRDCAAASVRAVSVRPENCRTPIAAQSAQIRA